MEYRADSKDEDVQHWLKLQEELIKRLGTTAHKRDLVFELLRVERILLRLEDR